MPNEKQPVKRKLIASLEAHNDLKVALDHLINTCTKHKVAIAGFIYGDGNESPLMLYNFGNTLQAAKIETYERLVHTADVRRAAGRVQHFKPSKAN